MSDPGRCREAGAVFATKPQLAEAMIALALDAGTPMARIAGDKAYGAPGLRADLERRS